LGEIKRRRVFQVAVVYTVVAWLLVQIVDVLNDPLSLPGWLDTVVVVLLAVGFPVAIILGWAFDLTPAGVVRTPTDDTAADGEEPVATPLPMPPPPAQPEILRNSVAVLPLDNLSPNPDDAYFAAGIHEEILNYVAKIKDVNVIARTSVKKYQGSEKTIAEIAAELGVGTIMEGSVRYAGDRVRVTAQLIDAATENHLWSEVYERDLSDIFAIQADIAEKIADALAAELSVAEKESIEKLPTTSPEAYALYLRAMTIVQDHSWSHASLPELRVTARSYLDEAIAADPEFAPAYVMRGHLFASLLNQDPGALEDYEARRAELETLAFGNLERALELDPRIGGAHGVLARIHQYNWRGKEARAGYERALELKPNDPEVLINYAVFLAASGYPAEALKMGQQAIRLNPNGAHWHMWLSFIHMHNFDLAASRESERQAVALSPTLGIAHLVLGHQEHLLGDDAESLRHARLAEEFVQHDMNPTYLGELVAVYARAGQPDDANRLFRQIEKIAETRRIPGIAWIDAYLGLDDEENVYHWLSIVAENPEPYIGHYSLMNMQANVYRYPMLDEPRFKALRDRIGYGI
jgi:TolB-like protein/Flp pilus assembly protein TadD